jgi:hypothetical protein
MDEIIPSNEITSPELSDILIDTFADSLDDVTDQPNPLDEVRNQSEINPDTNSDSETEPDPDLEIVEDFIMIVQKEITDATEELKKNPQSISQQVDHKLNFISKMVKKIKERSEIIALTAKPDMHYLNKPKPSNKSINGINIHSDFVWMSTIKSSADPFFMNRINYTLMENPLEFIKNFVSKSHIEKMYKLQNLALECNRSRTESVECCVCLEDITEVATIECKHIVCKKCMDIMKQKIKSDVRSVLCPICREPITELVVHKQYALIVLCKECNFNVMENGGYESVGIIYSPPMTNGLLTEKEFDLFVGVTFVDSNPVKKAFINALANIKNNNYQYAFCHPVHTRRWLKEVEIFDLDEVVVTAV